MAHPDRSWVRAFALLVLAACSSPPTGAVLAEVPDLTVVMEPESRGGTMQLRLENDADGVATFPVPACATTFEQFVGGGWQPIGTPPPCTGIPLTLPAGETFDYVIDGPTNAGLWRAVLGGAIAGRSFIARSAGVEVP